IHEDRMNKVGLAKFCLAEERLDDPPPYPSHSSFWEHGSPRVIALIRASALVISPHSAHVRMDAVASARSFFVSARVRSSMTSAVRSFPGPRRASARSRSRVRIDSAQV